MLDLHRPLVYISIESTGLDVEEDRVVELAMIKVQPNGKVEFFQQDSTRINPGVPIRPAATAVHRITKEMRRGCPSFAALSKTLYAFMDGCDLAGYNVRRLVVPMLTAEFKRCGIEFPAPGTKVVDAMRIFHKHQRRDLASAVEFFLNRPHKEEHGALEDAVAAVEVLAEMVVRYDLPRDVSALEAYACGDDATLDSKLQWSKSGDGRDIIVFDFGKYKGKTLKSVAASDPSYITWMMTRFPPDVCALLEKATAGRLHEVRRPPRRKQKATTKPTEHSVTRLLAVANNLASRAAEELTELLQDKQRSTQPAGLPSTLLQQVSDLRQLVDKLQQAADASRVPAAAARDRVTAAVHSRPTCSSSSSSSGDGICAMAPQPVQSCFSSKLGPSLLPVLQHPQHSQQQSRWAESLSQRLAEESLLDPPFMSAKSAMQQLPSNTISSRTITRDSWGGRFTFNSVPGHPTEQSCHTAQFNFGRYKAKSLLHVALVDPSYLEWMCTESVGFPADVCQLVREAQAAAASSKLRQLLPRSDTIKEDTVRLGDALL